MISFGPGTGRCCQCVINYGPIQFILVLRCWENLVLAMLGEQFMVGDEICGAVVSIRSVTFQIDSVEDPEPDPHVLAPPSRIRILTFSLK